MKYFMTVPVLLGLVSGAGAQAPGHFANGSATVTQAALSAAMGSCLLKRNRAGAIALATTDNERAEQAAFDRTRGDMVACLGTRPSATLDRLHLVGAIAEQLMAENDGRLLARVAGLSPVAPVRVAAGEHAAQVALACAMRADPVDAAALLRARAESREEAAAFSKLGVVLQACVPATGAVSIKPYIVRATIAVEAFQAVHHKRTVGALKADNGTDHA